MVCIALASPLLIEGALLLSNALDYLFDLMARLLSTPVGTALAVTASIPLAVWNRKRIF